ncbi:MAG: T9SS type A sorting domain-containing protein [Paludibacteraceae bacterium]|nr:T9SS type A sorting domain-containing protein [Paludibacteraceae bacterium]
MTKKLFITAITIVLCLAHAWAQCTQTFDANKNITIAGGNGTKTYNLSGAPIEKITFKASKSSGTLTGKPKISLSTGESQEYEVGDLRTVSKSWGRITNYNYNTLTWSITNKYPYPTPTSVTITNQNAKVIGITVDIYVQNIVVTQAKYFVGAWGVGAQPAVSVTGSTNRDVTLSEIEVDASTSQHITLYYSRANNITATIEDDLTGGGQTGDRDAFKITDTGNNEISGFKTADCEWGQKEVDLHFYPTRAGTYKARLTFSNNNGNTVVYNITASCRKKTPRINWKDFAKISTDEPVTQAARIIPANAGIALTLSYQDPADAEYVAIDGTTLTALKSSGDHEITIIATSSETAKYKSITSSHTFKTTDLKVQEILWNQNFTRMHVGDADQTLTATSSICMPITYSSDDPSVVTIVNGKLHIVGPGKTYIHATAPKGLCQCPAGCEGYNADDVFDLADAMLWVRVIDPNAGCDEYANRDRATGDLTNQADVRTNVYGEWVIELAAPAANMTFTAFHTVTGTNLNGAIGHIRGPEVQYSTNLIDNNWTAFHNYTEPVGWFGADICIFDTKSAVYDLGNDTISRDALRLRLYNPTYCTEDHHYSNALVTQATYLDRNGLSGALVLDNVSTLDTRTSKIDLYYSNLPEPIEATLKNNIPGLSINFTGAAETQNQTISCGTYGGWGGTQKEDKANGYYSTPLRATVTFQFDQNQEFPQDGIYRDEVTFKSGNITHIVPIEIHMRKVDQDIEWTGLDLDDPNVEIVDKVTLKAYALNAEASRKNLETNEYTVKVASLQPYSEKRMPITYKIIDNPDVATISGGVLTFLKEGTVTVSAEQKGDNRYNPTATDITKTITVTKVTPEVDEAPAKAIMYNGYYLNRATFEGGNVRYIGKGRSAANPKVASVVGKFNALDGERFILFADQGKAIDYNFQPDNTAHFNIDVAGKGKVELEVRRATLRFDGNAGTTDESTVLNYLSEDYENVRERLPLEDGSDNIILAAKMDLNSLLGAYDTRIEDGVQLDITHNGELVVNNELNGFTKDNVNLFSSNEGTGALRFRGGQPKAHVQMYSKAYYAGKGALAEWQFIGAPVDNVDAQTYFSGSWMYGWDENGWIVRRNGYKLPLFTGVAVTQSGHNDGKTYNFYGELTNEDRTFDLSYTPGAAWEGFNLIANSYAAPIDISRFEPATDFENVEPTIYIFNTGDSATHWVQHQGNYSIDENEIVKGQYTASTPGSAKYINEQRVIPAMQGFFVRTTGNNAKLHLNYERLVMQRDASTRPNKPARIPARTQLASQMPDEADVEVITVAVTGSAGGDRMHFVAHNDFNDGFENGMDAHKNYGESGLPSVYAVTTDGDMSISFVPEMHNKYLGVCIGNSGEATLTIVRTNPQETLYLHDLLNKTVTPLEQDTVRYQFAAGDGYDETRFRFSRYSTIDGGQTTALQDNAGGVTMKQQENLLHITAAGKHTAMLFDATGKLMSATVFNDHHIFNTDALQHGVYTLRVDTTTKRFVK